MTTSEGEGSRRVLLVEDNELLRDVIRGVLRELGFEADCVGSAEEGLRRATEGEYALIVSDVKLPGFSGIEMYRRLQEVRGEGAVRFILMTGGMMDPSTARFVEETGCEVIRKPFGLAEVRERLENLLSG